MDKKLRTRDARKLARKLRTIKQSIEEIENNIEKHPTGIAYINLLEELDEIDCKLFDIACFDIDI